MCLRTFGLYCSACLGILFVSILCMCCSHFSLYCFISLSMVIIKGSNKRWQYAKEIICLLFWCHTYVKGVTCHTFKQIYRRFPDTVFPVKGHAVAQLVEALCYKPEGHGFDSRWCHWNFSLTSSFHPHYGPVVNSASNRNRYQEYFLGGLGGRCVRLTIYHLHVPSVLKSGSLNLLEPSGPV